MWQMDRHRRYHSVMDRQIEPISLSPSTERFVTQQVEMGRYASASDVVERGVELLAQEEKLLGLDLSVVRRKLDRAARQIARGDVMDGEAFFEQLRREDRLKAERSTQPRPFPKRRK